MGDSLGDFKNELKEDEYMTDWVSTGPKSYCYITNLGNYECKIKGFSLYFDNSVIINMESMGKLIKKDLDEIITITKRKITRDLGKGIVLSKEEMKILQVTCTKRVVLDNYDTLPFGY